MPNDRKNDGKTIAETLVEVWKRRKISFRKHFFAASLPALAVLCFGIISFDLRVVAVAAALELAAAVATPLMFFLLIASDYND